MTVNVEGTLFIVSALEVTICTWQGEEATLPIAHLASFVDQVRSAGLTLPPAPVVLQEGAELDGD